MNIKGNIDLKRLLKRTVSSVLIAFALCESQVVALPIVEFDSPAVGSIYSIPNETPPLTLSISANRYIISDTQPILITITLTNNCDTPIRIFDGNLERPGFLLTNPMGETYSVAPLLFGEGRLFYSFEHYPVLHPHETYSIEHDIRTFYSYGWPTTQESVENLLSLSGSYIISVIYSQPSQVTSFSVDSSGNTDELLQIRLFPLELVSNSIKLEKVMANFAPQRAHPAAPAER